MKQRIILIFIIIYPFFGFNQNHGEGGNVDSLRNELNKPNLHDTIKIGLLSQIGDVTPIFRSSYWDTIVKVCNTSISKYSENKDTKITLTINKYLTMALNNIGVIYYNEGNIPVALEYYHKSLKIKEQLGDKLKIASTLSNIGVIYDVQGDTSEALDSYKKSLLLLEELLLETDSTNINYVKKGIAYTYTYIGVIQVNSGNINKAINTYLKSINFFEEIKHKLGMGIGYANIAGLYQEIGDPSIKSSKEESLLSGIKIAQNYYNKSIKILEEIDDKNELCYALVGYGNLYLNNYKELNLTKEEGFNIAKKLGNKSLAIANDLMFPDKIQRSAELLYLIAKQEGNFEKALENYELKVQYLDTLKNEKNRKAAIRQQTKYEFEKEQLVKEQKEKEEIRKYKLETERRNSLQYSIIFVAILVVFGLVLALGRINVSPKFAEGLIFFAFLIFFEFLLVLTDPYLDTWTGGAPAYKLLANAVLAALIFPAHAFFEKLLKKKLINKKLTQ